MSPLRELEPADPIPHSASELTEELALEELGRDGRAIRSDQRPLPPCASVMNRRCDQLFAGAGLAEHEHGGIRRRNELDVSEHGLERPTPSFG